MTMRSGDTGSYNSGAAVRQNRFVEFDGATGNVIEAGADAAAIGVCLEGADAADRSIGIALINGSTEMDVEAGAAVAVGDSVKSDAEGRGTSTGAVQLGIALSAASAAGEMITVLLQK